jgi:hypothetical protein
LVDKVQASPDSEGAQRPIPGLWHQQIAVPLSCYAEGLRALPADAGTAVATALSHLLALTAQNRTLTKRTKVKAATVPTTTVLVDDVNDGHAITAPDGASVAVGLTLVEHSGAYAVMPYTYNAGTDTLTGLVELPFLFRRLGGVIKRVGGEVMATGAELE